MDVNDAARWIATGTTISPDEAEQRLRAGWKFTRDLRHPDIWTTPAGHTIQDGSALNILSR